MAQFADLMPESPHPRLMLPRRMMRIGEEMTGGGERPKIQDLSWIDLYLPKQARPYSRLAPLDKPIGTWLLAWPCMW